MSLTGVGHRQIAKWEDLEGGREVAYTHSCSFGGPGDGMRPQMGLQLLFLPQSFFSVSDSWARVLVQLLNGKALAFAGHHQGHRNENRQGFQYCACDFQLFPCSLLLYIPFFFPSACSMDFKPQHGVWKEQPNRDCLTSSHNCVRSNPCSSYAYNQTYMGWSLESIIY